jgi:hypothetical protein
MILLDQRSLPTAGAGGEEHAIGGFETRTRDLTMEHGELMAQHEDLDILGTIAASAQGEQVDHESDKTVETGHTPILVDSGQAVQVERENPGQRTRTCFRHPQARRRSRTWSCGTFGTPAWLCCRVLSDTGRWSGDDSSIGLRLPAWMRAAGLEPQPISEAMAIVLEGRGAAEFTAAAVRGMLPMIEASSSSRSVGFTSVWAREP